MEDETGFNLRVKCAKSEAAFERGKRDKCIRLTQRYEEQLKGPERKRINWQRQRQAR